MSEKPKRRSRIEIPRQYASPEVEAALKGIKWKLGDPDQIRIRDDYGKLIKLYELEAGDVIRKKEMKRITLNQAARRKEIQNKERNLLWVIGEVKKKQAEDVHISTELSPDDIPI